MAQPQPQRPDPYEQPPNQGAPTRPMRVPDAHESAREQVSNEGESRYRWGTFGRQTGVVIALTQLAQAARGEGDLQTEFTKAAHDLAIHLTTNWGVTGLKGVREFFKANTGTNLVPGHLFTMDAGGLVDYYAAFGKGSMAYNYVQILWRDYQNIVRLPQDIINLLYAALRGRGIASQNIQAVTQIAHQIARTNEQHATPVPLQEKIDSYLERKRQQLGNNSLTPAGNPKLAHREGNRYVEDFSKWCEPQYQLGGLGALYGPKGQRARRAADSRIQRAYETSQTLSKIFDELSALEDEVATEIDGLGLGEQQKNAVLNAIFEDGARHNSLIYTAHQLARAHANAHEGGVQVDESTCNSPGAAGAAGFAGGDGDDGGGQPVAAGAARGQQRRRGVTRPRTAAVSPTLDGSGDETPSRDSAPDHPPAVRARTAHGNGTQSIRAQALPTMTGGTPLGGNRGFMRVPARSQTPAATRPQALRPASRIAGDQGFQ